MSCDKTQTGTARFCELLTLQAVHQFDCQGKDLIAAACFGSGMAMA